MSVQTSIDSGRKAALSATQTAVAALVFLLALANIPGIPVEIPANWIVIGTGVLAALRTAIVWLNPKDPSYGLGSGGTGGDGGDGPGPGDDDGPVLVEEDDVAIDEDVLPDEGELDVPENELPFDDKA